MSVPFCSQEGTPGKHWIEGWVGTPETVWTFWRRKENLVPVPEFELRSVRPVTKILLRQCCHHARTFYCLRQIVWSLLGRRCGAELFRGETHRMQLQTFTLRFKNIIS